MINSKPGGLSASEEAVLPGGVEAEEVLEASPGLSYEEINQWRRLSSGVVEEKLVELAGVCEQIPQL